MRLDGIHIGKSCLTVTIRQTRLPASVAEAQRAPHLSLFFLTPAESWPAAAGQQQTESARYRCGAHASLALLASG